MTQRWRPVPAGQTPILVIDATSADETYVLPAARPGHTIEIRRIDSSAHTVTLTAPAGWTVDGGTSTMIAAGGTVVVETVGASVWTSCSPSVPASTLRSQLDTIYATRTAALAAKLQAVFSTVRPLTAPVMGTPPTMTSSASRTVTTRYWQPQYPVVRNLGGPVTWDNATNKALCDYHCAALDFWLDGDTVELGLVPQVSSGERVWVWVDGQPATAAPMAPGGGTLPATTTAGTAYFLKLVFGSVARRRVTVYGGLLNAWSVFGTAATASVSPAPRMPRIAIVGDSYADYTAGSGGNPLYSYPAMVARALGAEIVQRGIGGTGYTTAQAYGSATRVSGVQSAAPDLIAIIGTVNDDSGHAATTAAATAAFDAYAAACPAAPIVVIGPEASNDTDTVASARQLNAAAVRTAALAHSQVIGYADPCGHADLESVPAAYSAGTTYDSGDRCTHLGSVWTCAGDGTVGSAPGTTSKWILRTWALYGTGNSGTPSADGSRDLLLHSDDVHPTTAGQEVFATRVAEAIVSSVQLAASGLRPS